ncbi:MAG: hypothetical protein ACYTE8_10155 [Planctomycetota bacterium]|jgi:hypothetical protein
MYKKFYKRYYQWCLEEWRRELREGFPFLKMSKIPEAESIISLVKEFPPDEIWNLCTAIVKRKNQHKLEMFGESFTKQDQDYHELFCNIMRKKISQKIFQSSTQEEFFDDMKKKILQKTPRRVIRKKVVDSLHPVLGDIFEKHGTVEWVYETKIGPWKLKTWIDTGGRSRQLSYSHSITYTNEHRLLEGISLERWLGIGGSETMWNNITESNLEQIVSSLTQLIVHFVDAAPKLLEGVVPEYEDRIIKLQ